MLKKLTGKDLVDKYGSRSSYGTHDYLIAVQLKTQLNQLGFAVRIVARLKSGGNRAGIGTYRVTWWPKPE